MNCITGTNNAKRIGPDNREFQGGDQCAPLIKALIDWGFFGRDQTAGKFYPIACVALEIVQRCNLDCKLCYLSHAAEMAHDLPLAVIFTRIDMIKDHYGSGTFIQITGGDPTLRKIEDLEHICRYIRKHGMKSCLMTNGIKATDEMLQRLATAGLNDVAFHVDTTQNRRGFRSEFDLNSVRLAYIKRGKRAGLRILFNTTIYGGNFRELPAIAQFFRQNAASVALTSFQMQADTGRGVICERDDAITQNSVMEALQSGMQVPLDFGTFAIGHPKCTRYASVLSAGNQVIAAASDSDLFQELLAALNAQAVLNGAYLNFWATARRVALCRPKLAARMLGYGIGRLWKLRSGVWSSRGKIHRMAVLVHNFMDAKNLQHDRCETCVFMVATENGPLSMCVHSAQRDHHIFQPASVQTPAGTRWWNAATGRTTATPDWQGVGQIPFKHLKGRMRADAEAKRTGGPT